MEIALNGRQGVRREDWRLVQRPELRDSEEGVRQREEFRAMLDRYLSLRECDLKQALPNLEALKKYNL